MTTLRPIRSYTAPAYPTAEALREPPRSIPRRWARRGATSLVVAALGVAPAACRHGGEIMPVDPSGAEPEAAPAEPEAAPVEPEAPEAVSGGDAGDGAPAPAPAPGPGSATFYDVGQGRGSVGCVVIAPPVFLTEGEAFEVIQGELASAGVTLDRGSLTLRGVTLPGTNPTDLELDGADRSHRVGAEFVSTEDLRDLDELQSNAGNVQLRASAYTLEFLDTARQMAQQLTVPQNLALGLFYDPATCVCFATRCDPSWGCEPDEAAARAKNVDQLRAQVRQFVDFLRASGTI